MSNRPEESRLNRTLSAHKQTRRGVLRAIGASAAVAATTPFSNITQVVAQEEGSPATTCGGDVSMLIRAPVTYNPLFATSGNDEQVIRAIFGTLVKMDDTLTPVPDLAETVESNEDGSAYTFTLREGLTFNDGTPLTSRDAAFTFERALDGRTGSVWQGRLANIAGAAAFTAGEADTVAGIETPDDRTLVITLEEPNPTFLLTLGNFTGFGILPEHVLRDVPPDQLVDQTFLESSVSAGPFELVRYETDQFVELRRNESYGGEPALLDRILMPIRTPAVAMAELERGEIDIIRLPMADLEAAQQIEGVSVVSVQGAGRDTISVNLTRPYFEDKRVRQAMMYAIDRQGIVDSVLQGQAEVVNSDIFGPDWMGTPEGLNPYEFDPDMARQLLAEANWDPAQKIVITITPPNEDAWGPIVHQQLRDVGFDAELLQVDVNEYIRQLQEADFDLVLGGGGTFRADPNLSSRNNTTENLPPAGSNWTRYSNPEVDELYDAGRSTADLEERKRIYTQLAQILNDELPVLYLWSPNSLFAVNDRVHGFAGAAYVDNRLWNAEEWSVDC